MHRGLGLPPPQHPLISLVNYAEVSRDLSSLPASLVLNLYKISFKFNFHGKFKYGQHHFDFDAGGMSFFAPLQLISSVMDKETDYSGYSLHIHPDFFRNFPLGRAIKDYGFFSYAVNEALCLSDQEKAIVSGIFESIKYELLRPIDDFSQEIIISQLEQLLNYSKRFYKRQFITRKAVNHDKLIHLNTLVDARFKQEAALVQGMLSVQELADSLNISPRYLSDMLRSLTGQNAQQYIQSKMIEKAKELLAVSDLTVAEIAYQLGFDYPQSFNKVFKKKTNITPVVYRQSFN
jgi:AraC-like DNA-binding protein